MHEVNRDHFVDYNKAGLFAAHSVQHEPLEKQDMPTVKMTEAWWKKNKAKTLTSTGISEALKAWQAVLKKGDLKKIVSALDQLDKKVDAAIKKANKALHKETIGYLNKYNSLIKTARDDIARLGKDLQEMESALFDMPVHDFLEKDKYFKSVYWDTYGFLYEMKRCGGTGNQSIYDTYVGPGADHPTNLPGTIVKAITADVAQNSFNTKNWKDAYKEMEKQWKDNKKQVKECLEKINMDRLLSSLREL